MDLLEERNEGPQKRTNFCPQKAQHYCHLCKGSIAMAPCNVVSSLLFFLEETYSNTRGEHAYFTLSAVWVLQKRPFSEFLSFRL